MHPSVFINDLWNGADSPTVFVAMSFAEEYKSRYQDVYEPVIKSIAVDGKPLAAVRVDERQSGDSIITDIVHGISEATIVLADISALSEPENSYVPRNGNVMYELGIAHAVKSADKALILKDDDERVIFDLTSIPHNIINFGNVDIAKKEVGKLIVDRIKEGKRIFDFKLKAYAVSMSPGEFYQLKNLRACPTGKIMDVRASVGETKLVPLPVQQGIVGLLKAGCAKAHHITDSNYPWYSLTERGEKLCRLLVLQQGCIDGYIQLRSSQLLGARV